MTDKIIKLVSNQAGPFTATSNLVDIDIPADGSYDFSKSFINLYTRINTTDANNGGKVGIWIPRVQANNDAGAAQDDHFYNVCFVKNASLSTQLKGRLEDINRVDILRQNLNDLTRARADKLGLSPTAVCQIPDIESGGTYSSIWRELHKEGSVASRELVAPIQIPLSQLFNLGTLQQYPASKLGRTRIHLELNLDKFTIGAVNTLGVDPGNAAPNLADTAVAGADGLTVPSVTTTAAYETLDRSPHYVGMRVQLSATGTNAAANIAAANRVVSAIVWNADQTLTLTLDEPLTALANTQQYTEMRVFQPAAPFAPNTPVIEYLNAQLVLRKLANPGKSPSQINYTTWSTEQASGRITNYQRQFQLEPNAVNCYIMFPNGFVSNNTDLRTARLRLDNEDLTNRDIQILDQVGRNQLLNDRLMMTLLNGGHRLRNLLMRNLATSAQTTANAQRTNGKRLSIIGTPVPMTPNEKLFQVNLTAPGAAAAVPIVLYKQLAQTLKI